MNESISISATDPNLTNRARAMAETYQFEFISDLSETKTFPFSLVLTPEALVLQINNNSLQNNSFFIDFNDKSLLYRIKQASLRKEMLARAMGISPKEKPIIIDATAGLARDAFILASLGYKITLIERSPVLYVLVTDGIERAAKLLATAAIMQRMELILADSVDWLSNHPRSADIVYLDPMFPVRKKSASVKKEMLILQNLPGTCDNSNILFKAAFHCAKKRVVVKRPRLAPHLDDKKPDFMLKGTTSRFDVYLLT